VIKLVFHKARLEINGGVRHCGDVPDVVGIHAKLGTTSSLCSKQNALARFRVPTATVGPQPAEVVFGRASLLKQHATVLVEQHQ
jgi:hypothetical protein